MAHAAIDLTPLPPSLPPSRPVLHTVPAPLIRRFIERYEKFGEVRRGQHPPSPPHTPPRAEPQVVT